MLKHEFSWSLSRKRVFERCLRAYYYNYYASWGGWDTYGSEKSKLLYRLKNSQDIGTWSEMVFRKALDNALAGNKLSHNSLLSNACFHMRRDLMAMKSPSYEKNPKNKLLKEYFSGRQDLGCLCGLAEGRIAGLAARFEGSGPYRRLLQTEPLARRSVPEPSCFDFKGIKVWARPDFLWLERDVLRIMNLHFSDPVQSGDWAIKAALDIMLMRRHIPGGRKIQASSCFLDNQGCLELFYSSTENEVSSMIEQSSAEMLDLSTLDTIISEDIFPKTQKAEHCSKCCFRHACESV
ncbi:MAG: hypothetical protein JW808_07260 [Victivallales bacterium]|nr:hypothetical protein [Victivallales bacterium]